MAADADAWPGVEGRTFYANCRRMSRAQVSEFCRTIKRPFGAGRAPIEDTIAPHVVDENLGYTVRDSRWHDKNERVMRKGVTKIRPKATMAGR